MAAAAVKLMWLLSETGLPVWTYIPKTDMRLEHLEPSDLLSACLNEVCWHFNFSNTVELQLSACVRVLQATTSRTGKKG